MHNEREVMFSVQSCFYVLLLKAVGLGGERGDPQDAELQDKALKQALAAAAAFYKVPELTIRKLYIQHYDDYERDLDRISPSSGEFIEFERQPFDFAKIVALVKTKFLSETV